jgi:hypothetical protein
MEENYTVENEEEIIDSEETNDESVEDTVDEGGLSIKDLLLVGAGGTLAVYGGVTLVKKLWGFAKPIGKKAKDKVVGLLPFPDKKSEETEDNEETENKTEDIPDEKSDKE